MTKLTELGKPHMQPQPPDATINDDTTLVVSVVDGKVTIRSRRQAEAGAQDGIRHVYAGSNQSVSGFLRDARAAADEQAVPPARPET